MDRGTVLLQVFLTALKSWFPMIERATYSKVEVSPGAGGEFTLTVRWKNKDGTDGSFQREYSRAYCFGASYHLAPAAWQVERRTCDHAKDFVRSYLSVRGVL